MDKLNHLRYFLSRKGIQRCASIRRIHAGAAEVFSFEFARLLLTCSELDVVFKVVCSHVAPRAEAEFIAQYFTRITTKYDIAVESVRLDRFSERVEPYAQWNKDTPPACWTVQNKVKHRRHEYFDQAILATTMRALCGLFVANLLLLNEHHCEALCTTSSQVTCCYKPATRLPCDDA